MLPWEAATAKKQRDDRWGYVGGASFDTVWSLKPTAKLYFTRSLFHGAENHNAHIRIVQEICRGDIWALYCKWFPRYIKNGGEDQHCRLVKTGQTQQSMTATPERGQLRGGKRTDWGIANQERECIAQKIQKKNLSSRPPSDRQH